MRGIILYHTSISAEAKCKFLSLFKFKPKIQYCIIDRYGISQILLDSIAQNLQLDIHNWNVFEEIAYPEKDVSSSQIDQHSLGTQNLCYYGKKRFYNIKANNLESHLSASSAFSNSSQIDSHLILQQTLDSHKIDNIHLFDDLWLLTRRSLYNLNQK